MGADLARQRDQRRCRRAGRACDRWRGLFRSAQATIDIQTAIIKDASRSEPDKKSRQAIRREAETQLETARRRRRAQRRSRTSTVYRYLASEGFLPDTTSRGCRCRRTSPVRERAVTRATSSCSGPGSSRSPSSGRAASSTTRGSQYEVDRVILPVPEPGEEHTLATARAKLCDRCGQLHEIKQGGGPDLCVRCGTILRPR